MSIYLWSTFLRIHASLLPVSSSAAVVHLTRWIQLANRVRYHDNHDAQLLQKIAGKPANSSG